MYKNNILKSILNKKPENQYFTATVAALNPLTVKLYPGDDAIPVVATTGLIGLDVGSRVILLKIGNQLVITNVIGNDSLMKCVLSKTASQTLTTSTETSITFGSGTEEYDPLNMHNTVTNNDRIIIPKDGIYAITIGCGFVANTTGSRIIYININGSAYASGRYSFDPGGHWRGSLSRMLFLEKDDYIRFRAYQSSGGNLNIGGTSVYQCFFSVSKV